MMNIQSPVPSLSGLIGLSYDGIHPMAARVINWHIIMSDGIAASVHYPAACSLFEADLQLSVHRQVDHQVSVQYVGHLCPMSPDGLGTGIFIIIII